MGLAVSGSRFGWFGLSLSMFVGALVGGRAMALRIAAGTSFRASERVKKKTIQTIKANHASLNYSSGI